MGTLNPSHSLTHSPLWYRSSSSSTWGYPLTDFPGVDHFSRSQAPSAPEYATGGRRLSERVSDSVDEGATAVCRRPTDVQCS